MGVQPPDDTETQDDLTEPDDSFSLNSFLTENYELIAILGVFGALTIYLSTLSSMSTETTNLNATVSTNANVQLSNLGVISSLMIFLVISYLLLIEFFKSATEEPNSAGAFIGTMRIRSIVFITSFVILTVIIAIISVQYSQALSIVIILTGLMTGWSLYGVIYKRMPIYSREVPWKDRAGDIIKENLDNETNFKFGVLAFLTSLANLCESNLRELLITFLYSVIAILIPLLLIGWGDIEQAIGILSNLLLVGDGQELIPLLQSIIVSFIVSVTIGFGLASISAFLYLWIMVGSETFRRYQNFKQ